MSRKIDLSPDRQDDPSPGWRERRLRRRIVIFIVVVLLAAALLATGRDLQAVLLTLIGVGLTAATIARWVTDDGPLPMLSSVLSESHSPRRRP